MSPAFAKGALIAAFLASVAAASGVAAPATGNVYSLCTVRDVTVADNRMVGKIYRSAVFASPADYEAEISLTPERGGTTSALFERFISSSRGFGRNRQSLSAGDEHYCVEAPLTAAGKLHLEKIRSEWDRSKFPSVDLAVTEWTPPRNAADLRFQARLLEYESLQQAGEDKYQAALAEVATVKASNARAAQERLDQYARDRLEHEAKVAESERKRQIYREDYKRVTGRYPDE